MIKFYNVSMVYPGKKRALSNINLKIGEGEFVYLIGASGAGKTTLLRLIYAELQPTEGVVLISDKDISRIKKTTIPYLRRNVGVVSQDLMLIENQNVYQNCVYVLEIFYMLRKQMDAYIHPILKKLELFTRRNTPVKYLSGGEKQRVAIGRALIKNPPILLLDEPTGNLDDKRADNLLNLIKDLFKDRTVIFATHDKSLIERYPARVIELNNGKIISDSANNEKVNISNI